MRDLDDEGRQLLWQLAVCRCNGGHIELEPGECAKCGHYLPDDHPRKDGAERYAAFLKRLNDLEGLDRTAFVHLLVERYRKQVAA